MFRSSQVDFTNFHKYQEWVEEQSLNLGQGRQVTIDPNIQEFLQKIVSDDHCLICNQQTASNTNKIIYCDLCQGGFHEACYGVKAPEKQEEKWFCDPCK